MDANGRTLTIRLLSDNALNMDHIFEAIDTGHLALPALIGTANDGNFVIFANRY